MQEVTASTSEQAEETVPSVNKIMGNKNRDTSCVVVRCLSNKNLTFYALVDTGSPVNLIKKSVYTKFCGHDKLLMVKDGLRLKGVNKSVISVYGKLCEQIILDKVKDQWFDITLLVVDDITMNYDILLG